jgi:hypothetical protein
MAKDEQEKEAEVQKDEEMMASEETYMTSGAHIGTRQKNSKYKRIHI